MYEKDFTEKDWKLFRKKISGWQEAYMEGLIKGYIELLSEDANPSDRFWELNQRIKTDKKKVGVSCEMRRSNFIHAIVALINEGAICFDDLEEFSATFKKRIERYIESTAERPV